jgi:ribosome maturation factor RimP
MRMANVVEKTVWQMTEKLLEGNGVELVDVEYVKEKDWYLRVFIDKPEGIGIEDCQSLSEKLEEKLDAEDVMPEPYILEVSSPGLDRVLKKPRDFEREKGKDVDVSLYEPMDGEKLLVGKLEGFDGAALLLEGREPIPKEKIAQVRLHIEI